MFQASICSYLFTLTNALAIFFEGYSKGVIARVNGSPDFISIMGLSAGNTRVVTRQTKLGGNVAVYYFGSIWGGFLAGWLTDVLGRIHGLRLGYLWCVLGCALQASA